MFRVLLAVIAGAAVVVAIVVIGFAVAPLVREGQPAAGGAPCATGGEGHGGQGSRTLRLGRLHKLQEKIETAPTDRIVPPGAADDRQCDLSRRHPVHARLQHGALRLPGRDARALYRSIHRLTSLPDEARVFPCHDYKSPPGRIGFARETTSGAQRTGSIHIPIRDGDTENEFVAMRTQRDAPVHAQADPAVRPVEHERRSPA